MAAAIAMNMTGCGSTAQEAPSTMANDTYLINFTHTKNKIVEDAIMKACHDQEWKETHFKSNTLIIEKVGEESASATLSYSNTQVVITKDNATMGGYKSAVMDLLDAIKDNIGADSSHH